MNVDDYSTLELIAEMEREARTIPGKPGEPDLVRDLLIVASTRLRQYQWMDAQRVREALASVKRIGG